MGPGGATHWGGAGSLGPEEAWPPAGYVPEDGPLASPGFCVLPCKPVFTAAQCFIVVFVHSLNRVRFFVTPWTAACQAPLSFTTSHSLLRTHVHWVGYAIQPSHPLSPPSPPTLFLFFLNFKDQIYLEKTINPKTQRMGFYISRPPPTLNLSQNQGIF